MDYRKYLRVRHGIVISSFILVFIATNIFKSFGLDGLNFLILIILGFSLFFERCRNCKGIIWLQKGRFFFNRYIGPFYLPSKCGRCGSLDFESPPPEE
jgi:hypothetical protein